MPLISKFVVSIRLFPLNTPAISPDTNILRRILNLKRQSSVITKTLIKTGLLSIDFLLLKQKANINKTKQNFILILLPFKFKKFSQGDGL